MDPKRLSASDNGRTGIATKVRTYLIRPMLHDYLVIILIHISTGVLYPKAKLQSFPIIPCFCILLTLNTASLWLQSPPTKWFKSPWQHGQEELNLYLRQNAFYLPCFDKDYYNGPQLQIAQVFRHQCLVAYCSCLTCLDIACKHI